jgi:hypothetical protein
MQQKDHHEEYIRVSEFEGNVELQNTPIAQISRCQTITSLFLPSPSPLFRKVKYAILFLAQRHLRPHHRSLQSHRQRSTFAAEPETAPSCGKRQNMSRLRGIGLLIFFVQRKA